MNEQEQLTPDEERRIDEGIDTAFRFLHQAFFEDIDLVLDVPSGTNLLLYPDFERAVEAVERSDQPVYWVPEQGRARRQQKLTPRWPRRGELNLNVLAVRYLRSVDTLSITLGAAPEKPIEAPYGALIKLTIDKESDLVTNVSMERFLEVAVPRSPIY